MKDKYMEVQYLDKKVVLQLIEQPKPHNPLLWSLIDNLQQPNTTNVFVRILPMLSISRLKNKPGKKKKHFKQKKKRKTNITFHFVVEVKAIDAEAFDN
jgi:hypothetical protein